MDITSFILGYKKGIASGGGSGGGVTLEPGAYFIPNKTSTPNKYYQSWYKFNGDLYAFTLPYTENGNDYLCYKYTDGAWVGHITTNTKINTSPLGANLFLNGKFHFIGMSEAANHYTWDGGTTVTQLNDLPNSVYLGACVYHGTLVAYSCEDGILYSWDESTDTWTATATIGSKHSYYYAFVINDVLYFKKSQTIYRYDNGTLTQIGTTRVSNQPDFVYGNCVYYRGEFSGERRLFKFDVETMTETQVGCHPVGRQFFPNASDDPAERPSFMIGCNDGFTCYDFYEFEATE